MDNVILTLIGEVLEGEYKWRGITMEGADGSLYGIPFSARRVVSTNLSLTLDLTLLVI